MSRTPDPVPSRKERRAQWRAFKRGAPSKDKWRDAWGKLTQAAEHVRQTRHESLLMQAKDKQK